MYPASQLIYQLLAKASSEMVSISLKKSFIRKGNRGKWLRCTKTTQELDWKAVVKNLIKWWSQIWNFGFKLLPVWRSRERYNSECQAYLENGTFVLFIVCFWGSHSQKYCFHLSKQFAKFSSGITISSLIVYSLIHNLISGLESPSFHWVF